MEADKIHIHSCLVLGRKLSCIDQLDLMVPARIFFGSPTWKIPVTNQSCLVLHQGVEEGRNSFGYACSVLDSQHRFTAHRSFWKDIHMEQAMDWYSQQ